MKTWPGMSELSKANMRDILFLWLTRYFSKFKAHRDESELERFEEYLDRLDMPRDEIRALARRTYKVLAEVYDELIEQEAVHGTA